METAENKRFIYQFGKFVLDPQEKTLFSEGTPLHLPAKEFETLLMLVENNGRALTKEEMMTAIWRDAFVEEVNLAKQISRLRKIFNSNGEKYIETLPKHGYRFSAEVNQIFQPAEETILEKRTVKRLTVRIENETPDAPPALTPQSRFLNVRFGLALCTVVLIATVAGAWLWRSRPQTGAKIDSIAVLPLKSLTGEENNKALGLGLTDALITKIGGLRQIVVRPVSAVAPYADAPQDSLEIGKKLNVDAVLEGTIQQAEGRVRLNVRLLRVENGEQLWAEQFESDAAQIFDLQDRLTAQTAQALRLKLSSGETQQITKRFTNSPEALDAYLKGRYFSSRRTTGDLKAAIGYFNEAIAKDPNYALAYVGLADAYSLLADYDGALPKDAYPKAKEAATKALELDDELAEAETSLAYVKMFYYLDWQGAQDGYRRAIALNPNYATARHWYSEYLTAMGRFDEAFVEARRAKEIDPLSPSVNAQEVWILYYARRYDEALERGRRIAEMMPDYAEIYDPLKRCYDRKGMYAQAIAARQKRRKLAGWDATETAALKSAASTSDAAVYWKKRLEQEIEEARNELPMPFEMAAIYAQLGEKDLAFEWLDKAIENRTYPVMFLRVTPDIDPLRSDARFADALRRVNLLF
jgi:TolB-like protein/DNA-binding winged helix-turn-helix (wHTH) protein